MLCVSNTVVRNIRGFTVNYLFSSMSKRTNQSIFTNEFESTLKRNKNVSRETSLLAHLLTDKKITLE